MTATTGRIDRLLVARAHHRAPRPAAGVRIVAGVLWSACPVPARTATTG